MVRRLLCIAFVFGTTQVYATPTAAPSGVQNNTGAQVVGDTDAKNRLWVLPPTQGRIENQKLSFEATQADCDSMKDLVESSKLYSHQIYILAQQSTALLKKMEATDDKQKAIEIYSQVLTLQPVIAAAKTAIRSIMTDEVKAHGGSLNVAYTFDQDKSISSLKALNPAYEVQAVPTYNTRLYFSVPNSGAEGIDPSLVPFVRTYSVNGITAEKLATTQTQLSGKMGVTIALTKLGACLMAFPEKFGSNVKAEYPMTALYQYPYMFNRKVNAKYNLMSIYKRVQESGTRGGFFSSKSYSNLVESNWGSSAFSIDWTDNDPESKISTADRLELEHTIKADLLANLDRLITQKIDTQNPNAPNPGPRGATVLAESLEKTCAANGYCAAAAIAFRVLDSIFGSSSMSSSVEKKLDVTASYDLNENTARYVTQGVTYAN